MPDLTRQPPMPAPPEALRPARFAGLLGKAMALGYRVVGKHRYDDFRLEWIRGIPILVTPSVFNPKLPRTGAFLAAQFDELPLAAENTRILDMGTGSGVCAVFAAAHSRHVVAVDINAAAVSCARINALLNNCEHRIDVRHGDLFAPVAGERFDLILFNPPFLRGRPSDDRDRAWRSSDVAERFAQRVAEHLNPGGSVLLVLSTFGKAWVFLEAFRSREFEIAVVAQRRYVNERLAVFRISPIGGGLPRA
jgi:HemK-related putative methylase